MPQDNRLLIAIGAGLAVVAAVVIALIFSAGRERNPAPPPAAQGGLTVDVADAPELNTTRELRCFVDGQYVGLATLSYCARRNAWLRTPLTSASTRPEPWRPLRPRPSLLRPARRPSN